MKIVAITPCLYPDHRPISMLLESARAHKWRIDPYKGDIKGVVEAAIRDGFTHILHLPRNSLVVRSERAFIDAYRRVQSPPFVGCMSGGGHAGPWIGVAACAVAPTTTQTDNWCDLFQPMDTRLDGIVVKGGRVLNKFTGTNPCILYFPDEVHQQEWWDKLKP